MATKKPFLSGWFGTLGKDPKVAQNLRSRDMLKQINNLGDDVLSGYKQGIANLGDNATAEQIASLNNSYGIADIGQKGVDAMAADPWKNGNAAAILGAYAKAHPFKTAAGVGLGAMNVGGLTDNDYYGGQIAGLLAGGLGSKFLGGGFSPIATMAGGALGSLFDKLRQKQADSNQNPYR